MDLVSPIIDIVSSLFDCTASRVNYIRELEENLNKLRTLMDELKDKRNDVRRKVEIEEANQMKRTDQVEGWLQRINVLETDVDGILRERSQEIVEMCPGGCYPSHCWSSYKLGKRVVMKIKDVTELKSKGDFDVVAERLPPAPVQEMPTIPTTTGMDLMFDKAWSFISEEQVGILGIYGMGGVGKTTLLKRINNEFLRRGGTTCDFDVVIWVVVSKEANTMKIQNEIATRLGFLSLSKDGSMGDRAAKLYAALSKKKFVLLLDDLWDRVDLEAIGIPHPNINNKSKVIFTTRSEAVCGCMEAHKKMRVECLNWPEAWKLFQDKVGNEALNYHVEIPAVAENVAKECAGLPLALITIGRAMASKKTPQEWRYAVTILKKSASEFSGMGDEVFPLLKFSYDVLPNDTIRFCFLYCSLFPEDHSIRIEQLIHYWIGEGFLGGFNDMDEAHNRGYDIVGILKHTCLLESCKDSIYKVKMHDVIRDLALWIGCECGRKEDKFLVRAGVNLSETPEVGKWIEAERISLMFNNIRTLGDDDEIPNSCPNLLTLIISQNPELKRISDGFFQYMHVLRFLNLSGTRIEEFPMSIVELAELQYLNLSRTMVSKLPPEMKNIVKLKYLELSYTNNLRIIPCETVLRLSKLQVLNLARSSFDLWEAKCCGGLDNGGGRASIEELECLKNLKYISIVIKNALSLQRFLRSDKFKRCTIELYINECQGLTSFPVLKPTILKSLKKLHCDNCLDLEVMAITSAVGKVLCCFPNLCDVRIDRCHALKDLLWLHGAPALESLRVIDCKGLEVICDRVRDGCFPNLQVVLIDYCPALKDVSWLRGAPALKSLEVTDCNVLEVICDGIRDGGFTNLQDLGINRCPALKDVSWLRGVLALKSLEVTGCNALKDLSWLHGAPILESLEVTDCNGLEAICDEVKDECFPKLHEVRIGRCDALKDLSWLLGAQNLKTLHVFDCKSLELICDSGNTEVKENPTTFSCLKHLWLTDLPELKSICWFSFPSNTTADIENCPKAPLRIRSS